MLSTKAACFYDDSDDSFSILGEVTRLTLFGLFFDLDVIPLSG